MIPSWYVKYTSALAELIYNFCHYKDAPQLLSLFIFIQTSCLPLKQIRYSLLFTPFYFQTSFCFFMDKAWSALVSFWDEVFFSEEYIIAQIWTVFSKCTLLYASFKPCVFFLHLNTNLFALQKKKSILSDNLNILLSSPPVASSEPGPP